MSYYESPPITNYRDVALQVGEHTLSPIKRNTRSRSLEAGVQTPKKKHKTVSTKTIPSPLVLNTVPGGTAKKNPTKTLSTKTTPPPLIVNGIPGTAKKKPIKATITKGKKVDGFCKVCNVVWESKEDHVFRNSNGKRKTTWIGCDKKGCKFWAHALCVNFLLVPKKKVEDHAYLCDIHKK